MKADITDFEGTCLSIHELGDFLAEVPANKIAILFDTCQSGGAAKGLGQIAMSRGIEERKAIADLAKKEGIIIFAAAGQDESAYEIKELENGIFTYSIVQLIQEHPEKVSIDGYISIGKLLSEVEISTRSIAEEYLNASQNPIRYSFGEDFYIGRMK